MESNKNTSDNFQEIINRNGNVISIENLNYLYPNGHRITHQMRWFKASRHSCFKPDKAA